MSDNEYEKIIDSVRTIGNEVFDGKPSQNVFFIVDRLLQMTLVVPEEDENDDEAGSLDKSDGFENLPFK